MDAMMGSTSKDLLEFEQPRSSSIESTLFVCSNGSSLSQKKNLSSSSLGSTKLSTSSVPTSQESTLLVCSNGSSLSQKKNLSSSSLGSTKLSTSSVPASQVLGRVKDFLGVMAEANRKLEQKAKEDAQENYDIEVLTGNEKEYIEMDLMLGVAELHTQEAVDAAEHAMAGTQPSFLSHDNDDSDSEENSEDSDEDDADPCNETKKRSSNAKSDNTRLKKQQKIVELI